MHADRDHTMNSCFKITNILVRHPTDSHPAQNHEQQAAPRTQHRRHRLRRNYAHVDHEEKFRQVVVEAHARYLVEKLTTQQAQIGAYQPHIDESESPLQRKHCQINIGEIESPKLKVKHGPFIPELAALEAPPSPRVKRGPIRPEFAALENPQQPSTETKIKLSLRHSSSPTSDSTSSSDSPQPSVATATRKIRVAPIPARDRNPRPILDLTTLAMRERRASSPIFTDPPFDSPRTSAHGPLSSQSRLTFGPCIDSRDANRLTMHLGPYNFPRPEPVLDLAPEPPTGSYVWTRSFTQRLAPLYQSFNSAINFNWHLTKSTSPERSPPRPRQARLAPVAPHAQLVSKGPFSSPQSRRRSTAALDSRSGANGYLVGHGASNTYESSPSSYHGRLSVRCAEDFAIHP